MSTVYMTYGIPRSGKTTWAKQLRDSRPGQIIRVNRDDLRSMMCSQIYNAHSEKQVVHLQNKIIESSLRRGFDVVVDDTNFPFGGKNFERICSIAKRIGNVTVIEKFFDISIKEAIKRNKESNDGKPVPEGVIEKMFNDYVKSQPYDFKSHYFSPVEIKEYNYSLHDCIIFDIDGTLSINRGKRQFFEWDKVDLDDVHPHIIKFHEIIENHNYLKEYPHNIRIIIVTGREDLCEDLTKKWLQLNKITYDELYFRKTGDARHDTEIKKEIYRNHIENKYNVIAVFDDRDGVVDMWRSLGLTCLHVAPGDF
jgi:predicted kinase